METKLESLKRKDIGELVREKDLYSPMTLALIVSSRQIDLLRLIALIDDCEEFRRIHHQITFEHLAIVKKKEWEEFKKWKEKR